MTERRFTLPLQALEPISIDGEDALLLMLLNPTGGLVGGDRLEADIGLGPGAHVCVTTPSAARVYRTLGPPAIQKTQMLVGPSAILEYFPEHVIPHPGSALRQSLDVEMESGSRALIYDAFAVGRLARGERWQFTELANRMTVRLDGKVLFHDRIHLRPRERMLSQVGGDSEFGYVATLILISDGREDWDGIVQKLEARVSQRPSVFGGGSLLGRDGCFIRFLTLTAHDCVEITRDLWARSREALLGRSGLILGKW